MIMVHMNIGDFFMGGKPVAEWDLEDICTEKMSILDSLIRDKKVRSISVILNVLDDISRETTPEVIQQLRKVCDYFHLIFFWGLRGSTSEMIEATEKFANEDEGNIYVLSREDANHLSDSIMNNPELDVIIYEADEDRDEVMGRIVNRIAYLNNLMYLA